LLEAGAIDGARGILINITGSSSLKLSEVNEASTIIQNAAHEDANIIFGAVQDESMGDEVKITVIATGFKQQEMPQRRERMLAEATLPTVRYDVPIQPRVVSSRPAASRFASEMESEPIHRFVETNEVKAPAAVVEPVSQAELIPVPASVFDDDFFRAASPRETPPEVDLMENEFTKRRENSHIPTQTRVQHEDVRGFGEEGLLGETSVRTAPFGGPLTAPVDQAVPDELDIPAFLRRGN
jgi:cell division protein FtsZ